MKMIPLGTNGFFSSFDRQTACFVLPYKDRLLIFDAGSGLFRLGEPEGKKLLRNAKYIDIFLSHYHFDHTFGFYAAFNLFEKKNVTVYARSDRKVFSDFSFLEYFPINYDKEFINFSWKAVDKGTYSLSGYKMRIRRQNHRGEVSLAFTIEFPGGKTIAYVTDGEPIQESVEFVRGVNLLLHEHEPGSKEAKSKKLEDHIRDGNVTTEGAALIAREAAVKRLYLIHHNPFLDNEKLEKELTKIKPIFKESKLAKDLEVIEF